MSEIDKIQLKNASGQLIAEYDLPGGSSSDTKVTQTYTNSYSNDYNYELLFSETPADSITRTEGSRKNYNFRFNPYKKALTVGSRFEYDETTSPPQVPYGNYSTVIGERCAAKEDYSFAHGADAIADGSRAFASGDKVTAGNYCAHAEGAYTNAYGSCAHAEGYNTSASGNYSHAEGQNTIASGANSHTEGYGTEAYGNHSHAEGGNTIASSSFSHAEGDHTQAAANAPAQHVQGKYNIIDSNNVYAHIVGNGTSSARSNAYALRWNGQQDVTNDIVRVDSGGTWDGANKSLEDSFKWNIGECSSYDADAVIYYDYYEIAEIEVNPGTAEDNYEHQDDISNPIIFEISQIVNSKIESIIEFTGYSVLELAFKFNTATNETEVLQFLSSNSLDYYIQKDSNDSNIWHLYGHYRTVTNASPRIDNKSVLHRIYGSGVHDNITIIMQNVTSQTVTSRIIPTRNFVKLKDAKSFVRNSAIANNYDSTATYEVGDLCFYQSTPYSNVLYVCNTAISTPEDFDSTHWTRVTLPEYFVKKSGDTMTGQLVGMAGGTSWVRGRTVASLINTAYDGSGSWFPITSVKSKDGSWEMGTLTDSNNLYFSYASDTNFNNNANQTGKYIISQHSTNGDYYIAHSGNVGTGDSNGQVKIAGTNVSVKGLAAAAYKGVFTRSSVGDIGWGTEANRTKVLEVNAIAFWNGRHSGTSSNLQYCDRGRFGTIVTKGSGDYLPINPENIEFTNNAWHFLDFHWQGSTDDFTARLIESSKGTMRLYYRILTNERVTIENQYGGIIMYHGTGSCVSQMRTGGKGVIEFLQTGGYGTWATCKAKAFSVQSSKWIKENINDLTDEEALKLLNLRPVTFDYTDGVTKNCRGLIAEEAYEELPYCVDMPEEYLNLDHDPILEADKDEDTDIGILPSIDYSKFVPHLIKLCQIQQKQIDELTERVTQLEASGFKFEV